MASVAGRLLCNALVQHVKRHGRVRLGLSGGSTPGGTLNYLRDNLPDEVYAGLYVTWVDERHPEASNQALATAQWLYEAPQPACVLPMVAGGELHADHAEFAAAFEAQFGSGLDVVLLGAGPDGHIASLFPGHAVLSATPPTAVVTDSPKPPPTRLTLTLPVLQNVSLAVMLARGEGKADMLARALRHDPDLPLGVYAPKRAYHWVLDPDAARALS